MQMLLATDARARRANRRFYRVLAGREREIKSHSQIDEKNIQVFDEIRADYKRRQGNLVLKLAKSETCKVHQAGILREHAETQSQR